MATRSHISAFSVGIILLLAVPLASKAQFPDSLQDQYLNALKLIGQDQYEQGIADLQQIILGQPNFSKPYRNLVETYIFINQLDSAAVFFQTLIQENSENPYANYALARIDFANKNYDQAVARLKTCIKVDPAFADAYSFRGGLPEVYRAKKDLDSGIEFFQDIIASDPENARGYYGLARCHIRKYEWGRTFELLEKAIELDSEFTLAYHAMVFSYFSRSRDDKVLEISEELFKIADSTGDLEMVAYASMMIGGVHRRQGDYTKALYALNEALKTAIVIGDKRREASCLNNLANVYALSGSFSKALDHFNKSLQLKRKSGAARDEVRTLTNIGAVYSDQEDYDQALSYYRHALQMARERGFKREESSALSKMANVMKKRNEVQDAIRYYQDGLRIAKQVGDKNRIGFVLKDLGRLYHDVANYPIAESFQRQALEIGLTTGNAQMIWQSQAGLGACFERQGQTEQAIYHYSEAIALYDSVRKTLDIESLGSGFLEYKDEAYPSIVMLLAENGKLSEALVYAEKYKSSIVTDIISQRESLLRELLTDSLRAKLARIGSDLEYAHSQLEVEISKTKGDKEKVLSLGQRVTDLELKKAMLLRDFSPQVPRVEEIQATFLSRNQAIVEYVIGPEQVSIFVLTPDTLHYSKVSILRTTLREMMVRLSSVFDRRNAQADLGLELFDAEQAGFSIRPAHELYKVLFSPIEPWLQNAEELIIVADDVLYYLPFELLVVDSSRVRTRYDFGNAEFLLEKYVISYAPAISLLHQGLRKPLHATKGILAIGNPHFGSQPSDPGGAPLLASKQSHFVDVESNVDLTALPNTGKEVTAIGEVFQGADNKLFLGKHATEQNLKEEAEQYGIIHLATHFLINDTEPLYSKVVLSQSDNAGEDNYLQTYEVFNMNLNAELVVLSACNTARGRLRKGEGVIGVSRAFQFAGVPSLVASLWSVDDESTSVIMTSFYQHLKSGLNKPQALRFAKLDYLKTAENSKKDPYYWAPFILIGDGSPVNLPSKSDLSRWLVLALLLAVMSAAVVMIRKQFSHSSDPSKKS